MWKILYKSVLSFIGLFAAGWGVEELFDLISKINQKSTIFILVNLTILSYIFWLIVAVAYTYALFLLFKYDKHRTLIMHLTE